MEVRALPEIEASLILLAAVAALATLADRIKVPYPILLVLGGLVLGCLPSGAVWRVAWRGATRSHPPTNLCYHPLRAGSSSVSRAAESLPFSFPHLAHMG